MDHALPVPPRDDRDLASMFSPTAIHLFTEGHDTAKSEIQLVTPTCAGRLNWGAAETPFQVAPMAATIRTAVMYLVRPSLDLI